jgi:hypothetical protein
MNYLNKYLKYKNKYNALKNQTGSASRKQIPITKKRGAMSRLFSEGKSKGEDKGEGEIQKKSRVRSESPTPARRPTYHESKSEPDRNQLIINKFFEDFKINQITPIDDKDNNIHLDGYTENIYGENPINDFNFCDGPNTDKYAKIDNSMIIECIYPDVPDKTYKMAWSNPDKSKRMNILYHNVLLSDLVHPIEIDSKTSYTYVVVRNITSNNYSIIFCQVFNITEIGAKHTIIAGGQCIIVSGELAIIKKNEIDYEYVININSSLMKYTNKNNKLNFINNIIKPSDIKFALGHKFYYIYKYNIIFKLLKLLNPDCNIRIMKNTNITVNEEPSIYEYSPYKAGNEVLFDFYKDPPLCVSSEFVTKYNEFGMKEDTSICIDVVEKGTEFTKISRVGNTFLCNS